MISENKNLHTQVTIKGHDHMIEINLLYFINLSCNLKLFFSFYFRYCKNGSQKRFKESNHLIEKRHTYLRSIRKYRQEGREIVYLDETWLNANHAAKGDWLSVPSTSTSAFEPPREGSGRLLPRGKGSRLIILDVGSSQQGMLPDCALVFKSKTNSQDYHEEMNVECFTEWFKGTLLPKLKPASAIVMDRPNAPYHSQLDT